MFAGGGSTNVNAPSSGAGSGSNSSGGAHAHGSGGYSNAMAEANDLDALVFEFGTSKCKFGYAGEDFPRVWEGLSDLNTPVERAATRECDPEQLAQWLFDTSASKLQTRLSDHPLLLVERSFPLPDEVLQLHAATTQQQQEDENAAASAKPLNAGNTTTASSKKRDLKARERMVEVLMEQMDVPALFCAKSAVLTCYANARTSGLVVEMGATYTSITSVHEGYAFAYPKTLVAHFGGHDLDAFLQWKLQAQLKAKTTPAQTTNPNWAFFTEAKESGLCRVADGAFDEVQNAQLPLISYELPDKTIIQLGTERFSVAEQYFMTASSSSTDGNDSKPMDVVREYTTADGTTKHVKKGISLPELICDAASMTHEAELRKELFQNIVLTGGSSCFENMPNRLEREVLTTLSAFPLPVSGAVATNNALYGANMRVKVVAAHTQERKIGAFLGGSIIASLGSFHEMWMSKAEYGEHGAALIHKKCP